MPASWFTGSQVQDPCPKASRTGNLIHRFSPHYELRLRRCSMRDMISQDNTSKQMGTQTGAALWTAVWRYLNKLNMELPYDP